MAKEAQELENLPPVASEYIEAIIRKMRYRQKVRREVRKELAGHFADALAGCKTDQERQEKAQQLIGEFGGARLLAKLIRRGKKRCRPLWVKGLLRIGQAGLLLMVLFSFYTVWFITGKPNPRIDYLAMLNEMGRVAVSQEDNSWPMYEKAGELYVQPNETIKELAETAGRYWIELLRRPDTVTDVQKAALGKWIEENEEAWQTFVAASMKTKSFRKLQYESVVEEKQLRNLAVPLGPVAKLLQLTRCRIWNNLQQGQPLKAIGDCMTMLRLARSLHEGNSCLVDFMVAILYGNVIYDELLHIVETESLTSGTLRNLQEQIMDLYPDGYPYLNTEPERLVVLDTIQHTFTEGGPGGGHVIPNELIYYLKLEYDIRKNKTPWHIRFKALGLGISHAGRIETLDKINELWDYISIDMKKTPYERKIEGCKAMEFLSTMPKHKYYYIDTSQHIFSKTSYDWYGRFGRADRRTQAKTKYEATVTILAIKRWKLEKSQYPEKLEELIDGGYLVKLAMDPYSDKSLVYRRTDDGFTLYSVGYNFTDDDGTVSSIGPIWGDEDSECDAVFWPVGEN